MLFRFTEHQLIHQTIIGSFIYIPLTFRNKFLYLIQPILQFLNRPKPNNIPLMDQLPNQLNLMIPQQFLIRNRNHQFR